MRGGLDLAQQGLSPYKKYKTSWRSSAKNYQNYWPGTASQFIPFYFFQHPALASQILSSLVLPLIESTIGFKKEVILSTISLNS